VFGWLPFFSSRSSVFLYKKNQHEQYFLFQPDTPLVVEISYCHHAKLPS